MVLTVHAADYLSLKVQLVAVQMSKTYLFDHVDNYYYLNRNNDSLAFAHDGIVDMLLDYRSEEVLICQR